MEWTRSKTFLPSNGEAEVLQISQLGRLGERDGVEMR